MTNGRRSLITTAFDSENYYLPFLSINLFCHHPIGMIQNLDSRLRDCCQTQKIQKPRHPERSEGSGLYTVQARCFTEFILSLAKDPRINMTEEQFVKYWFGNSPLRGNDMNAPSIIPANDVV